jgi:multidrug efflux pump subunit AcrB
MTTFRSFFYTLAIALISSGLYAQTTVPQSASALAIPETGDNLIRVGSSMPDSLLYLRAGQILTESGFAISKTDSERMIIQTEARKITKAPMYPYLVVSIVKGAVQVTGFMESAQKKSSRQPLKPAIITNSGAKDAPMRIGFDYMSDYAQRLANSINGTVTYINQQ